MGGYIKETLENIVKYCEKQQIYDKLGEYGDFYYRIKEILKDAGDDEIVVMSETEKNDLYNDASEDGYSDAWMVADQLIGSYKH